MKLRDFYKAYLPLLLAFFNVIAGNANTYTQIVPNLDPRNYDYLQEDQNTSAYLITEVSTSGPVQVTSKEDLSTGGYISGKSVIDHNVLWEARLSPILIRDKKEILKAYIFPFHFFW